MGRNIDIGLMRTFAAVADVRGMTAASRVLNLTQAAVSQHIKRLEEVFDSELFVRDRRNLRLTSAGERLLAQARRLIALNDEIYGLMTAPEHEGEIRLGVPQDIVGSFMPQILKRFHANWPRVRVSLTATNSIELNDRLKAGALDMTVTTDNDADRDGLLFTDQLVWLGAPGGVSWRTDPLPVGLNGENCAFRAPMLEALRATGRDWHLTCELHDMTALFTMVEADLLVIPCIVSVAPACLEIIDSPRCLPPLPPTYINLRRSKMSTGPLSDAFESHVRRFFEARQFDEPTGSDPSVARVHARA